MLFHRDALQGALPEDGEPAAFSQKRRTAIIATRAIAGASRRSLRRWRSVLFNTFHDILPGSSIERAYDDQFAWLGVGWHDAQRAELAALNVLASRIDTSVQPPAGDMPCAVPIMVWNPHPFDYEGPVELEACVDYARSSPTMAGPASCPSSCWTRRAPAVFPAAGAGELFYAEDAMAGAAGRDAAGTGDGMAPRADGMDRAAASGRAAGARRGAHGGWDRKRFYQVSAQAGQEGIHISRNGRPLFGESRSSRGHL